MTPVSDSLRWAVYQAAPTRAVELGIKCVFFKTAAASVQKYASVAGKRKQEVCPSL